LGGLSPTVGQMSRKDGGFARLLGKHFLKKVMNGDVGVAATRLMKKLISARNQRSVPKFYYSAAEQIWVGVAMQKNEPIRSVSRALDILKTINRLHSPTLTEISRITSLPYPTTFRIVHTLIDEGMIEQEPFRKRYKATEQVKMLSSGFQEDDLILSAALEPMNAYTQKHLWPVALTVRVGNRMMVKHSTNQLTTQTFENYYPGDTMPLLKCSSGRVYLAFCSDEERETIIAGLRSSDPKVNELDLDLVASKEYRTSVREAGYAEYVRAQHNKNPGKTSAFAVPVIAGGQLRACLTVVFFAEAHKMDEAIAKYLEPTQMLAQDVVIRASQ